MATIKLTEYECECDECDGVITYTKSDIVKGWETERFEDPLNYDFWDEDFYVEYIHCPNCNKKIYFKNIPFEVYEQRLENGYYEDSDDEEDDEDEDFDDECPY